MDIEKELNKLVRDNLPAATANQLSKYLDKASAAIEDNEALKKKLKFLETEREELFSEVNKLNSQQRHIDETIPKLQEREKKLFEAEIRAAITLEYSQTSKAEIFRLVETVFKNPVVRQHTSSAIPVYVPTNGSGYHDVKHVGGVNTTEVEGQH